MPLNVVSKGDGFQGVGKLRTVIVEVPCPTREPCYADGLTFLECLSKPAGGIVVVVQEVVNRLCFLGWSGLRARAFPQILGHLYHTHDCGFGTKIVD